MHIYPHITHLFCVKPNTLWLFEGLSFRKLSKLDAEEFTNTFQ